MLFKIFSILLAVLFLMSACKKENPPKKIPQPPAAQSDTLFRAPILEQSYLEQIRQAQQQIVRHPKDKTARAAFLKIAYLPMRHMLVTVGAGRQLKEGTALPRGLVKRAALLDAKRWAAYGKAWLIYKNETDFGKLNTYYKGYSKTMPTFTRHDSLFIPIVLRIY